MKFSSEKQCNDGGSGKCKSDDSRAARGGSIWGSP